VIEVFPCKDEADELASLGVYNEVWPHDKVSLAEVRSYKASLPDHLDLLARVDGRPSGSAICSIQPQSPEIVYTLLTVLSGQRRRGVGTAIYEAVSDWSREHCLETLEVPVLDNDPESLAYAERRGFAEERREKGVVLHLAEIGAPEAEPPDGVEIVTWAERPELANGMYEVAVEAFPDVPGFEEDAMEPFEDWLAHDLQGSGDFPEATFVAIAGGEVIGYAKFHLSEAQPTSAYHDLTGVKRAWRGRGVARALKATQIGWAKANGYDELHTRNDERNTPIRRLNDHFGYRPGIGRIHLRGPLA
jgi:mycothiol synthase